VTPVGGNQTFGARLRPALPILLILALTTVTLWPSPASLLRYWREILDYQHGFLIVPIVLGWIARELWRGAAHDCRPSWTAALLLAPVLLAWIVAVRGGIDIAHQLLWPVLLALSAWAVAGSHVARRVAPAIALLYAAIPVWDYGVPVLQRLSIFFSEHILGLLGVPATVSEFHVTIPEGTFAIIEGCSGKRYFVVTLAMAYLAIAINHLRGWRALLFLAFSVLLSMLANWIRIVIVIYAGHVSNMQSYLVVNEHETLGNALFLVLIAVVLLLGRWLSRGPAGPIAADREDRESGGSRYFQPMMLAPVAMLVVALLAGHAGTSTAQSSRLGVLPLATGSWQGPLPPQAGWHPEYLQPDDQRRVAYVSARGAMELYVNLYADQKDGRELIQYVNNLIAPALWTEVWGTGDETLEAGGWRWSLREMEGPDQRRWIVAYTYMVKDRTYRSELVAKLAYGWLSIAGPAPSGVLAAATPCDARNCTNARKLVTDFWENMRRPMEAIMPAGTPSSS
jgi:EpsI family protein